MKWIWRRVLNGLKKLIKHTFVKGMYSLFDRLGVNVASVLIGALFFLIAISWIEAFKGISNKVFFDDAQEGRRYSHQARKKILSAVFVSVLAGVIIIFTYLVRKFCSRRIKRRYK